MGLSDPEAIRFRYKLHETDKDWHEAAAATPVTYRNVPPGSYHFTGIPVCILVLKKPDDVLFLNAAEHFEKGTSRFLLTTDFHGCRSLGHHWRIDPATRNDGQMDG